MFFFELPFFCIKYRTFEASKTIAQPSLLCIYGRGVSFEQVGAVYDETEASRSKAGMSSSNLKSGGVFKRIIIKYYDPASEKE